MIKTYLQFPGDSVPYGGSGVIYALSQYSPFISIPRYSSASHITSPPFIEEENSNLGIEDADPSKQAPTSSSSVSPSSHEQPVCNEPGICYLIILSQTLLKIYTMNIQ